MCVCEWARGREKQRERKRERLSQHAFTCLCVHVLPNDQYHTPTERLAHKRDTPTFTNKAHTQTRTHTELWVKQLPGLTTLTLRDLWQERGESNNKLYRSRLETPLGPHTYTYAPALSWINGCCCVKDRIVQKEEHKHTFMHKGACTVQRRNKGDTGQKEQNVSSDLNSLIWQPAIWRCSIEQMLTPCHAHLNTFTSTRTNVSAHWKNSY